MPRHPLLTTLAITIAAALLAPSPATASTNADDTLPDLSGVWAQEMVLTSTYRIALIAKFTNVATTYLRVEIDQNGPELELTSQVCHIHLEDSAPGFRPELPDAFLPHLAIGRRPARITLENGQPHLVIPRDWDIQGMQMRDPDNESLPDGPDDPRVFDHENDGHPGFAVNIHGIFDGTIHLARRNWDRFHGPILSPDRIEGRAEWASEQVVLDATHRLLRTSPTTKPDLDRSTFRMVRLSPDTTCDTIARQRANLF